VRSRRYLAKLLVKPLELRESVTVVLPAPADEVWDLMWDPRNNSVFNPDHELGVHVPGTPLQEVGELQLLASKDAQGRRTVHLIEVVDIEPGRRAVTECTGCGHESGAVLDVVPLTEDSCQVTQVQWHVLPTGSFARLVEPNRAVLRKGLDDLAAVLHARFS
jgi:hypothetical protein